MNDNRPLNSASDPDPERDGLVQELNRHYDLELAERLSGDELEAILAVKLNALIQSDFSGLLSILYRVDVSEHKLKELLRTNAGEDAGTIMARLIIERQEQKIKTRKDSGRKEAGPEWKDV